MDLTQALAFLLLGLGTGAVYAALALGLVLTYRGSGVINFAHGAVAAYGAYVYSELVTTGDYVHPIIGLPGTIDLGEPMATAPAILLALASSALLGLLLYYAVFRPLRSAPALSRVVASIGLMLVLQAVILLRFGSDPRTVQGILPAEPLAVLGATVPSDRFLLAIAVLVVAGILAVAYRFTRLGLATRAAQENELGASLLGFSPDRLAATNWAVSSALAGGFGILVAPITGLDPLNYTLLVIPALAAVLVARLTSFWIAAVAGLAIGMVQSELALFQSTYQWLPQSGLQETVPFAAVIAVMLLAGKSLPTRDFLRERRPPSAPRPQHVGLSVAVTFALALGALLVLQGGYRVALTNSLVAAVICLSLVVLTGFVGQISLAQMAFAGCGGFLLSKLAVSLGIPMPFAPILAVAGATLVGTLVALPAIRIRGVNLAIVTLAAGVCIEKLVFANSDLTGGQRGSTVPSPEFLGVDLSIGGGGTYPRAAFGIFVLVVLTALCLFVLNLRRSTLGRRMLAVAANERAAAAAGLNVARTKVVAFAISSAIAGTAGCLIGWQQSSLSFASFGIFVSLSILTAAYLGGITSVSGAVIGGLIVNGGLVFTALDDLVGFGRYETLALGLAVVVTAVMNPEGISGATRQSLARLRRGPARPVGSSVEAREVEGVVNT